MKFNPNYKCLLDLDGVLVDFMRGAHKFYGIPYSYDEYPYKIAEWDCLPPSNANMTTAEFWDGLTEDFWASNPWMPDGKYILELVERYFPKEDICILTSPTRAPGCAAGKMRWIQEHLPQYARQFLIGTAKQFCASPERILIDDADHNIQAFEKAGGKGILVPRKWNTRHFISENVLEIMQIDLSFEASYSNDEKEKLCKI